MKCTALNVAWVSFVLGLSALPSTAERNLVPTIGSTPDVCAERPSEPEWMQNIALRDAYQRVLVQDIYRAQNLEGIVQAETIAPPASLVGIRQKAPSEKTMRAQSDGKCCKPRIHTTAAPMSSEIKRRASAKPKAIGRVEIR